MDNNENNMPGQGPEEEDLLAERKRRRAALRRRRILQQRLLYGGVLLVLIVIIVLIAKGCSGKKSGDEKTPASSGSLSLPTPDPADQSVLDNEQESAETPAANKTTFTLSAVGDVTCYEDQLTDAYDAASGSYDFSHCLTQASKYISASDVAVATLETTLSGADAGYQGKPDFNSPEALAADLSEAGFDILSTACTYSLQHGISGLISTIKNVRNAGMDTVGTYYTAEDRSSSAGVVVREINGLKVGFLAYTKGCNGISVPEGYEYAVNVLYKDYTTYFEELDEDKIVADLTAARALGCDVLVAILHWGSEYETTPSTDQTAIADLMFQNGVDIIIGSHPHYLQPFEIRTIKNDDGEERQVFICYSLGNFLSSMSKEYSNDSVILNLTVSKDNDTGKLSFDKISYVPVYISGQANRFTVYDINQAVADFNAGSSTISEDLYATLRQSLENIHKLVGSDYDIGNTATYEPTPIIDTAPSPEADPDMTLNVEVSPAVSGGESAAPETSASPEVANNALSTAPVSGETAPSATIQVQTQISPAA